MAKADAPPIPETDRLLDFERQREEALQRLIDAQQKGTLALEEEKSRRALLELRTEREERWKVALERIADSRAEELGIKRDPVQEHRKLWEKVLDLLMTGNYASAGFALALKRPDIDVWEGVLGGLKGGLGMRGGQRYTYGMLASELGAAPLPALALGLVGDIFLDPLTYVPGIGLTKKGELFRKVFSQVAEIRRAEEIAGAAKIFRPRGRLSAEAAATLYVGRKLPSKAERAVIRKAIREGEKVLLAKSMPERVKLGQASFYNVELIHGINMMRVPGTKVKVPFLLFPFKFKPVGTLPVGKMDEATARFWSGLWSVLRRAPGTRQSIDFIGTRFDQWFRPSEAPPGIWGTYVDINRYFDGRLSGIKDKILIDLDEVAEKKNMIEKVMDKHFKGWERVPALSMMRDILRDMVPKLTKEERSIFIHTLDDPARMLIGEKGNIAAELMRKAMKLTSGDPKYKAVLRGDPKEVRKLLAVADEGDLAFARQMVDRSIRHHENAIRAIASGAPSDVERAKRVQVDLDNLYEARRAFAERGPQMPPSGGVGVPPPPIVPRPIPKAVAKLPGTAPTQFFGTGAEATAKRAGLEADFLKESKKLQRIRNLQGKAKSPEDMEKLQAAMIASVETMNRIRAQARAIDEDMLRTVTTLEAKAALEAQTAAKIQKDIKRLAQTPTMRQKAADVLDAPRQELAQLDQMLENANVAGNESEAARILSEIDRLRRETLTQRAMRLGDLPVQQHALMSQFFDLGAQAQLRGVNLEAEAAAQELRKIIGTEKVTAPVKGPAIEASQVLQISPEEITLLARNSSAGEFERQMRGVLRGFTEEEIQQIGPEAFEKFKISDLRDLHANLTKQGSQDFTVQIRDYNRDPLETVTQIETGIGAKLDAMKLADPNHDIQLTSAHIVGPSAIGQLDPADPKGVQVLAFFSGDDADPALLTSHFQETLDLPTAEGQLPLRYTVLPWKLTQDDTESSVLMALGLKTRPFPKSRRVTGKELAEAPDPEVAQILEGLGGLSMKGFRELLTKDAPLPAIDDPFRDRFVTELRAAFPMYTDEQVDHFLNILDAAAWGWTGNTGRHPRYYYKTRFAGVIQGLPSAVTTGNPLFQDDIGTSRLVPPFTHAIWKAATSEPWPWSKQKIKQADGSEVLSEVLTLQDATIAKMKNRQFELTSAATGKKFRFGIREEELQALGWDLFVQDQIAQGRTYITKPELVDWLSQTALDLDPIIRGEPIGIRAWEVRERDIEAFSEIDEVSSYDTIDSDELARLVGTYRSGATYKTLRFRIPEQMQRIYINGQLHEFGLVANEATENVGMPEDIPYPVTTIVGSVVAFVRRTPGDNEFVREMVATFPAPDEAQAVEALREWILANVPGSRYDPNRGEIHVTIPFELHIAKTQDQVVVIRHQADGPWTMLTARLEDWNQNEPTYMEHAQQGRMEYFRVHDLTTMNGGRAPANTEEAKAIAGGLRSNQPAYGDYVGSAGQVAYQGQQGNIDPGTYRIVHPMAKVKDVDHPNSAPQLAYKRLRAILGSVAAHIPADLADQTLGINGSHITAKEFAGGAGLSGTLILEMDQLLQNNLITREQSQEVARLLEIMDQHFADPDNPAPNIRHFLGGPIGWSRINTVTTQSGMRVGVIQEIQSDIHQQAQRTHNNAIRAVAAMTYRDQNRSMNDLAKEMVKDETIPFVVRELIRREGFSGNTNVRAIQLESTQSAYGTLQYSYYMKWLHSKALRSETSTLVDPDAARAIERGWNEVARYNSIVLGRNMLMEVLDNQVSPGMFTKDFVESSIRLAIRKFLEMPPNHAGKQVEAVALSPGWWQFSRWGQLGSDTVWKKTSWLGDVESGVDFRLDRDGHVGPAATREFPVIRLDINMEGTTNIVFKFYRGPVVWDTYPTEAAAREGLRNILSKQWMYGSDGQVRTLDDKNMALFLYHNQVGGYPIDRGSITFEAFFRKIPPLLESNPEGAFLINEKEGLSTFYDGFANNTLRNVLKKIGAEIEPKEELLAMRSETLHRRAVQRVLGEADPDYVTRTIESQRKGLPVQYRFEYQRGKIKKVYAPVSPHQEKLLLGYDPDLFNETFDFTNTSREEIQEFIRKSWGDPLQVYAINNDAKMRVLLDGWSLFQEAHAATTFLEDGRAIISALHAPDASSFFHELGHVFQRDVLGKDLNVVEGWLGITDGVWTRPHHERFARAWELYGRKGVAPIPRLKETFRRIGLWLRNVYRSIRGGPLDVEMTPAVRRVFDRLLGAGAMPRPREINEGLNSLHAMSDDLVESFNTLKRNPAYTIDPAFRASRGEFRVRIEAVRDNLKTWEDKNLKHATYSQIEEFHRLRRSIEKVDPTPWSIDGPTPREALRTYAGKKNRRRRAPVVMTQPAPIDRKGMPRIDTSIYGDHKETMDRLVTINPSNAHAILSDSAVKEFLVNVTNTQGIPNYFPTSGRRAVEYGVARRRAERPTDVEMPNPTYENLVAWIGKAPRGEVPKLVMEGGALKRVPTLRDVFFSPNTASLEVVTGSGEIFTWNLMIPMLFSDAPPSVWRRIARSTTRIIGSDLAPLATGDYTGAPAMSLKEYPNVAAYLDHVIEIGMKEGLENSAIRKVAQGIMTVRSMWSEIVDFDKAAHEFLIRAMGRTVGEGGDWWPSDMDDFERMIVDLKNRIDVLRHEGGVASHTGISNFTIRVTRSMNTDQTALHWVRGEVINTLEGHLRSYIGNILSVVPGPGAAYVPNHVRIDQAMVTPSGAGIEYFDQLIPQNKLAAISLSSYSNRYHKRLLAGVGHAHMLEAPQLADYNTIPVSNWGGTWPQVRETARNAFLEVPSARFDAGREFPIHAQVTLPNDLGVGVVVAKTGRGFGGGRRVVQLPNGAKRIFSTKQLQLATVSQIEEAGDSVVDFMLRVSQADDGTLNGPFLADIQSTLFQDAQQTRGVAAEIADGLADDRLLDIGSIEDGLNKRQILIDMLELAFRNENSKQVLFSYLHAYAPRVFTEESKWGQFIRGGRSFNWVPEWFTKHRTLEGFLDEINRAAEALGYGKPFEEDVLLAVTARTVASAKLTTAIERMSSILKAMGTRIADVGGIGEETFDTALAVWLHKMGIPDTEIHEWYNIQGELRSWEGKTANDSIARGKHIGELGQPGREITARLKALRARRDEIVPEFGIYMQKGALKKLSDAASGQTLQELLDNGVLTTGELGALHSILQVAKTEAGSQMVEVPISHLWHLQQLKRHTDGWILPRSVVDHMNRYFNSYQDMSADLRPFQHVFDVAQNWWKSWTLGIFPMYHTRNAISNMWNAYLGGVDSPDPWDKSGQFLSKRLDNFVDYYGKPRSQKELEAEITGVGILNKGQFTADIPGYVQQRFAETTKFPIPLDPRIPIMQLMGKRPKSNVMLDVGLRIGRRVEDHARVAMYLDGIQKGLSPFESAKRVRKYLFDYEDLTSFERNVAKKIFPFYTFTRKNIPLQLEHFITKRPKYVGLYKAREEIEAAVYENDRPDPRLMPEWMNNQIPVPVRKFGPGQYSYFVLGNWLPASDLVRMWDPAALAGGMVTPIGKVPFEWATGYSLLYKDRVERFPRETGEFLGLQLRKRTINLLRTFRLFNEMDKLIFRQDVPVEERLTRSVFGKIYPVDYTDQRRWAQYEYERESAALKAAIKRETQRLNQHLNEKNDLQARMAAHNIELLETDLQETDERYRGIVTSHGNKSRQKKPRKAR